MGVIDRATAHYKKQDRLEVLVPEWGEESDPLVVYVHPMTMAEVNMMKKIASKKASNIEQAANIIVVKAKDADGNRLFKLGDRDRLMQECDYKVVSRIAEEIEEFYFGSFEETKGNSEAIQAD
jgi:molybdopterin-guanine dinucleotide biosynthesis protein A